MQSLFIKYKFRQYAVKYQYCKRVNKAFGQKDINAMLQLLSDDVEWGEPENPYNPAGGTRKVYAVSWNG